jgi:predicted ATPase
MSRLNHIAIEHYRAFERGLDLDLRPLTLIYGKNNAGKSSVVRLAGILQDSLAESTKSPFDLSGDAGGDVAFLDVLNARNRELKYLRLTLTWDDGFEAAWRIGVHEVDRIDRVRVEELSVTDRAESGQARPRCWFGDPKVPEVELPEGADRVETVAFAGLVPLEMPPLPPLFFALRARLLEIRGHVQYLSAVRAKPASTIEERGAPPALSANGTEAQEILLYDRAAFTEVQTWLREEVKRDLRRDPVGAKRWSWLLPPIAAPELSIPLASTGEGMTQLLPILVALASRRTPARLDGKTYMAMEEPTTHLHDDLQIRLAKHLAKIAMEEDPPVIVLETHARPLLLGVQLAIKEGLDPARVILYWVAQDESGISHAEAVEFDRDGLPTSRHLRTAFADERRLMRELAQAHLRGKEQKPG